MDTLDRNTILDMIGAGRGSHDGVWIPLPFVQWLGSYESAAMLNQFFYWRDIIRREGRTEFYKSYDQWRAELCLTERQVRNGLEAMRAVGVRTRAARDPQGNRVLFYSLDPDAFLLAYQAFLSGRGAQNVPAAMDETSEPPVYDLYGRSNTENTTETTDRESVPPARIAASDVSPQANGHSPNSNGHLVGYDTGAPQSKGARPVAAEEPPPVVVKVPPGTPVNRRPDAPAVRAVPKPDKAAAQLARWHPDAECQAWWGEQCTEEQIPPDAIDVPLETKKWREAESSQGLKPGQYARYWRMWMLRAIGRWRDRPAPAAKTPPRRRSIYEVLE